LGKVPQRPQFPNGTGKDLATNEKGAVAEVTDTGEPIVECNEINAAEDALTRCGGVTKT